MIMKKLFSFLMLLIGFIGANTMNAQSRQMTDEEIARDIVGSWTDQELLRSANSSYLGNACHEVWVFNADGTLTIKRTNEGVTWKIAGYSVTFDLYQERVEKRWSIYDGDLEYTHLPLRNLIMKVKNPSLSGYNANVQQKIKAAIPEFEKNLTRETQLNWEQVIGTKGDYTILYYSKNKMKLKLDNQEFVLIRNVKGYLDTKVTKKTGTLNGHDYVDLGLPSGTLWATCNVGAESYNQNGSYYVYGETMPKQNYTEDTYKFYLKQNGKYYLKKYCSSLKFATSYDYVDGKDKLDPIDDVAHVKWGGDWRIPTVDQLTELINKCKWEKLNDGVVLTGPNGNSIFLPAAGIKYETKLYKDICKGVYMSNTISSENPYPYCLNINSGEVENCYIFKGYSVRPVNTSMALELKKERGTQIAEEVKNAQQSYTNEGNGRVFDVVEVMPQFPGGPSALSEYLSQNIHYPVVAEENGVQGRVFVSFVVEKDGSLSQLKVAKGVDLSLDKEALRVVRSMPKWIPGKANGKAVRVKYTMPVTFKLQ